MARRKRVSSARYRQTGSLAGRGGNERNADFSDWYLHLSNDVLSAAGQAGSNFSSDVLELGATTALLCCPEDHYCSRGCREQRVLCASCEIPVCRQCRYAMADGEVLPRSMMNDNWWGYVDNWVYECNVTWMEKACSSPYWTGLMLFCIDQQSHGGRKHLLQEPLYQQEGRIAWKGQLFSAPMDWRSMLEQLKKMAKQDTHISLPITGAVLAARMRVVVTSGLVDVSRLLRQATVRRNVVVQLIRMHRDAGHPDYVNVDMRRVNRQSEQLAPTDDATRPFQTALRSSSTRGLKSS